jgi:hypothetical protein
MFASICFASETCATVLAAGYPWTHRVPKAKAVRGVTTEGRPPMPSVVNVAPTQAKKVLPRPNNGYAQVLIRVNEQRRWFSGCGKCAWQGAAVRALIWMSRDVFFVFSRFSISSVSPRMSPVALASR